MRKGREEELKNSPEHADPIKPSVKEAAHPSSAKTLESAKLDWSNLNKRPHQRWFTHYQPLIDLRKAEIVPRLFEQSGFAGQYELLGVKSVLVTWKTGDGSSLRLYANLADETQEGVPPLKGRQILLQRYADEGRRCGR
ncbi:MULTISPECIES: DUF3459 domain-containing protein [unclassified Devosia]|uniref:DUF3459 domain-containing protein n=1 Tax=unclassified Devosia TaxID=196773 RepID=UPI0015F9A966|nr:DUF3459 domain-containing protein [Devosia sp. MC521]MBJ6989189.1 DUF3459 domain-containing protein [Devosia sp. MC521]QMW62456.1 DUF3459 domain-containing protein [Devosia sp. MC521]